MLGKLMDGVLVTPSENELKKVVITNPTEEQLMFIMGYKNLVIDEIPEIEETQYLEPIYEEMETEILQHWEVKDNTEYVRLEENVETETE